MRSGAERKRAPTLFGHPRRIARCCAAAAAPSGRVSADVAPRLMLLTGDPRLSARALTFGDSRLSLFQSWRSSFAVGPVWHVYNHLHKRCNRSWRLVEVERAVSTGVAWGQMG